MFPTFSDPVEDRIARFEFSPAVAEKIRSAKRCFIVGMGPSLAKVDFAALSDELVIGVNMVLQTGCTPDIICISDPGRVDKTNIGPTSPKVITPRHVYERHPDFFDKIDGYHDIDYVEHQTLKTNVTHIDDFDPTFSKLYWAASVVAELAVPLSIYLGMKDIYVLGLDGARASFPVMYAGGVRTNAGGPHASTLFHFHEKVAFLAKKLGTNVYNASFGGVVEAFPKVDLGDVKPEAVKAQPVSGLNGRCIVMSGARYEIQSNDGYIRLTDMSGARHLRHKNMAVVLEKDDGSEQFAHDAAWIAEPSFANRGWISIRPRHLCDLYITLVEGTDGLRLRKRSAIFSPYFSSFRPFKSRDEALTRLETDTMLKQLEQMRNLIGNMMVRNDRLS